ncbi:MAG: PEP/pyruvate-binding domain-containing protein [Caldilineaceae bacterium]
MSTFVLPLGDGALTPELAGDKAATLSRLLRAGFRVPKGFVVTTDAYEHFVHANRLNLVIDAIWARIDPNNMATFEAAANQIRALFAQTKVPPEISSPIRYAYNDRISLEETVVVRSSAYVQGYADKSFAGQHEAHLNVIGEQAIVDAVVRCWSSLWSTRAIAYRIQHGIQPSQVSMGVIVQLMIPARMSGGLFTINPVTGDPHQMIINSVWGLSTMLMDGQGTPDTFVADSESGQIIEEKIANKTIQVVLDEGRLRDAYVDLAERIKPSLSELHVAAIVALGRQLVKAFGAPQDVEWAILNSRLYILQARPITANTGFLALEAPGDDAWPPTAEKDPHPYDLWTLADAGERWPEPVTPLTWSTWAPVQQRNMEATFASLKADYLSGIQWIKRIYGRIYFNEGALAYVLHEGYGVPASTFADGVGSLPDVANRFQNWRWVTLIQRSPLILRQVRDWDDQIKRFERDFPQIDRWVAEFMENDLSAESDQSLWSQARGSGLNGWKPTQATTPRPRLRPCRPTAKWKITWTTGWAIRR